MSEESYSAAISSSGKQYCIQKRVEARKHDEAVHHLNREETAFLSSHDFRVRQVQRRMEILRDKRNKIIQERKAADDTKVFTINDLVELSRAAHDGQTRRNPNGDLLQTSSERELQKVSFRTPPPTPYSSSDEDSDWDDRDAAPDTPRMGITRTNRQAGHYSSLCGFSALPFMGLARKGETDTDNLSKGCLQYRKTPGPSRDRGSSFLPTIKPKRRSNGSKDRNHNGLALSGMGYNKPFSVATNRARDRLLSDQTQTSSLPNSPALQRRSQELDRLLSDQTQASSLPNSPALQRRSQRSTNFNALLKALKSGNTRSRSSFSC